MPTPPLTETELESIRRRVMRFTPDTLPLAGDAATLLAEVDRLKAELAIAVDGVDRLAGSYNALADAMGELLRSVSTNFSSHHKPGMKMASVVERAATEMAELKTEVARLHLQSGSRPGLGLDLSGGEAKGGDSEVASMGSYE